jgi:hypothetical protein
MNLTTKLTPIRMCVNQLRPTEVDCYVKDLGMEGVGDCSICKPDLYNKFCRLYMPLTVLLLTYALENDTDRQGS